jgi:hypothetical protein
MRTRRYIGTWAVTIDIDEPVDVDTARRHDYRQS